MPGCATLIHFLKHTPKTHLSVRHNSLQTCWNDADVEVTWLQHHRQVMFWNPCFLLCSSNHAMQQLTEHAVSAHANHTVREGKEWAKRTAVAESAKSYSWLLKREMIVNAELQVLFRKIYHCVMIYTGPKVTCLMFAKCFNLNNGCWLRSNFMCVVRFGVTYPSNPVRSFFRIWSLAWLARSVTKTRWYFKRQVFIPRLLKTQTLHRLSVIIRSDPIALGVDLFTRRGTSTVGTAWVSTVIRSA